MHVYMVIQREHTSERTFTVNNWRKLCGKYCEICVYTFVCVCACVLRRKCYTHFGEIRKRSGKNTHAHRTKEVIDTNHSALGSRTHPIFVSAMLFSIILLLYRVSVVYQVLSVLQSVNHVKCEPRMSKNVLRVNTFLFCLIFFLLLFSFFCLQSPNFSHSSI